MRVADHSISNEFPEYQQRIQHLLDTNHYFAALVDRYHAVDRIVHDMEERLPDGGNGQCEPYKKQRLHLKDKLYHMLLECDNTVVN